MTTRVLRSPYLIYATMVAVFASAAVPLAADLFFHADSGLRPQGDSLDWHPALVGLHVVTDTLIGLAYVVISAVLIYLARKAGRSIPFLWAFVAFGLFIIACGFTHFVAALTVWEPAYWFAGAVKSITAIASVTTAFAVPPLAPKVLALIDSAKASDERRDRLEERNRELADLTARLEEAHRLQSQLIANVSHELRTPLALILGPIGRRLGHRDISDEERRELLTVNRNAQLLLRHVDNLLDLAKLDAGRLSSDLAETDLARLVRLTAAHFDVLAHERRITFAIETPDELPTRVDPNQMQRVVLNLLANAFKFVPDGGDVRCTLNVANGYAVIDVEDSGPGVPPGLRDMIFERFRQGDGGSTRPHGGTGLGLAIAREFVSLHSGAIAVDDSPIGGARFRVVLPLAVAERSTSPQLPVPAEHAHVRGALAEFQTHEQSTDQSPATRTAPPDAALVLVVEDHPDMRQFVAEELQRDFRVETAENGKQGLALARSLRPDLIVSDVMMPGMSGDQLLLEVQADPELAMIPVLMLTAKADEAHRIRLLRDGAQDYVVKPVVPEELRARVCNLVTLKRAREVLQREVESRSADVATLAEEVAARKREAEDAVRAREHFLSIAAHELRTPVTRIKGFAELFAAAESRGKLTAEQSERYPRRIVEASQTLSTLLDDLLDVTRIQQKRLPLRIQPIDVVVFVRRVVDQSRDLVRPHHELIVTMPEGPCWIDADPVRLEQVLANLIDNALKYTPAGGRVEVTLTRDGDTATLAVADSGIGLPPDALEAIFEPFARAPNAEREAIPGIGLGLAICRGIVEQMGGRIWAESAGDGRGTSVIATFPASKIDTKSAIAMPVEAANSEPTKIPLP